MKTMPPALPIVVSAVLLLIGAISIYQQQNQQSIATPGDLLHVSVRMLLYSWEWWLSLVSQWVKGLS